VIPQVSQRSTRQIFGLGGPVPLFSSTCAPAPVNLNTGQTCTFTIRGLQGPSFVSCRVITTGPATDLRGTFSITNGSSRTTRTYADTLTRMRGIAPGAAHHQKASCTFIERLRSTAVSRKARCSAGHGRRRRRTFEMSLRGPAHVARCVAPVSALRRLSSAGANADISPHLAIVIGILTSSTSPTVV
jgi:hypothetical protein